MKILHTEASPGWGGQELRILKEAEGMRKRGHEVFFAVEKKGKLGSMAQKEGFVVYEYCFEKKRIPSLIFSLFSLVHRHKIEIINTHSSLDAWLGGIVGKLLGRYVIRTRHLSTSIRTGLNSKLLYNFLADHVVTTCKEVVPIICKQAKLPKERCCSIPTGIEVQQVTSEEILAFRQKYGIQQGECLVGTLCVLRGWKGVSDFLQAAALLRNVPKLKWIIVGGGVSEAYFHEEWEKLQLHHTVIFAGHHFPPYTALAAMDIFLLLSWANEGVSQASLQAAFFEKPLITTPTGGLKEVCIHGKTGILVPIRSPQAVADAVLFLSQSNEMRQMLGKEGKKLVCEQFTFKQTLDQMETIYARKQHRH